MQNFDTKKWVSEYSDSLFRFASARISDRDAAKDLVQDTFLAAWKNKDNFRGGISENNWLFTILKNKIIDHYRKTSRQVTETLDDSVDSSFEADGHWTEKAMPINWLDTADQKTTQKDFQQVLTICRSKLKELQNTVFTMKYLDDMDSEEICKVLNLTASNYWVIIHRARIQLRTCLEKNWFN